LDNSTYKYYCTAFVIFESHYVQLVSMRYTSETRDSFSESLIIFLLKFSAKIVSIIKIGFVKIKHYE